MRRLRGAIVAACWAAVIPASAESQQRPQPMRVRIHAPTIQQQPLVGSLMMARADSFTLVRANGLETGRMPASAIVRMERSEGRDRTTWMRYGGVAGVVAAAVFAKASGTEGEDLGLPIAGAVLGAIGGFMLAPERWTRIEYQTQTR